jgi:hypothetical protein
MCSPDEQLYQMPAVELYELYQNHHCNDKENCKIHQAILARKLIPPAKEEWLEEEINF